MILFLHDNVLIYVFLLFLPQYCVLFNCDCYYILCVLCICNYLYLCVISLRIIVNILNNINDDKTLLLVVLHHIEVTMRSQSRLWQIALRTKPEVFLQGIQESI